MTSNNKKSLKTVLVASAATAVLAFAAPQAKALEKITFEITEQSLDSALNAYGVAADRQVMYSRKVVAGKTSSGVIGDYEPDVALEKILDGTALAYRVTDSNVILVGDPRDRDFAQAGEPRLIRVAQADVQTSGFVATIADDQDIDDGENKKDVVVVTGTRIKGVKDQFSPVRQIAREDMDLAGYAVVSDIFDDMPQNFGGGASLDTGTGASAVGAGGTGVNLRGLGNEATLVLLNGRRLAPGGGFGDYVDISSIPTSAIDRVEVVTDGASAIYGSDAIAGVVNIILRDDFDGAESRLNLSTLTEGGGNTLKAAQTIGFSNENAHGLVSYEYSTEDELDANDREFSEQLTDPTYLLPFNQKHSVFASGGITPSDRFKVLADGYYNHRKSKIFTSTNTTSLAQNFQESMVEQYGVAAGVTARLFSDWEADLKGAYTRSNFEAETAFLHQGPGAGLLFTADTKIASMDASVGGSLFGIAQNEPVKAVLGVHYRSESADLERVILATDSVSLDSDRKRDVFAAFGEIYAPLITEQHAVPGINRLAVTVAARFEDYDDVGSSFDPKFGAVWSPFEGLSIRGTYGTSFRAPRLDQLIDDVAVASLGVFVDPLSPFGESVALDVFGAGSNDLNPEEAESWTVGIDIDHDSLKGFRFRGTYFNVAYDNRVGQASASFDSEFRFTNFPAEPIRNPDSEVIQGFVDRAGIFFNFADFFPALGPLDLADVTVILDERPQNVSISNVEGIDLQVNYELFTNMGDLSFSFNSTILTEFTQQFSTLTPINDLLDTFGNPANLRIRGGVVWTASPAIIALNVNHVGGYTDDESTGGSVPISSWTTLDASLRLNLGEMISNRFLENTSITVSAANILNEDPPTIGPRSFGTPVYDNANANPAGRRVGVLLTKLW